MYNIRRIALNGISNARDLGGFMTEDGNVTKFHRFIRSEDPFCLSETELDWFVRYNVRYCIDLRSAVQIAQHESPFKKDTRFTYHAFASDLIDIKKTEVKMHSKFFTSEEWGAIFFELFENQKQWFGKAMNIIAQTEDGVIFNCYSGRNRSNLLAFMLLKIAKVPNVDIIAEYSTNEIYLNEKYNVLYEREIYSQGYFRTPSSEFEKFIKMFEEKYTSINQYLEECNVSVKTIEAIRKSFVQKVSL